MTYIVYKTTNKVNNKIYIGVHKQLIDPYSFDGYLGSGTLILKAISLHGKSSFIRETISIHSSAIEAFEKEREIVNETFISDRSNYNTNLGGIAPPSQKGIPKSEEHKRKIGDAQKGKKLTQEHRQKIKEKRKNQIIKHSDETKEKISNSLIGHFVSDETKEKMSKNHADFSGENNPMYGKEGYWKDKNMSDATREKMKFIAQNNQKELTCPHCSKTGKTAGMLRWHFSNCRSFHEPENEKEPI